MRRPCAKSGRRNTKTGPALRRAGPVAPHGPPAVQELTRAGGPTRAGGSIHGPGPRLPHQPRTGAVTFHIQDMTEVLTDVIWAEDVPLVVPFEDSEPLAAALDALGAVPSFGEEAEDRRADSSSATRGGGLPRGPGRRRRCGAVTPAPRSDPPEPGRILRREPPERRLTQPHGYVGHARVPRLHRSTRAPPPNR